MHKKYTKYIFTFLMLSMLTLTGCKKEYSNLSDLEEKVKQLALFVLETRNKSEEMTLQLSEMQQELENIKKQLNINTGPLVQAQDIIFSSVRIVSPYVIEENGKKIVSINSNTKNEEDFYIKIDLTNTTDKELNRYYMQAILLYQKGNTLMDSDQKEVTFDILPKTTRKDILIRNFKIKKGYTHNLILKIRDENGNLINTKTFKLPIK